MLRLVIAMIAIIKYLFIFIGVLGSTFRLLSFDFCLEIYNFYLYASVDSAVLFGVVWHEWSAFAITDGLYA